MQKYIAANMLEMTPWDGVNIAVGESEIYGGPGRSPELAYLIPIMFFKTAEHFFDNEDNSQISFNFKINVVKNFSFYLPIFFDEFKTTTFLSPTKNHNQLGFTLGGDAYDLFYHDTRINVEYTRINPWVYNHQYAEDTVGIMVSTSAVSIRQIKDLPTVSLHHRPFFNLEHRLAVSIVEEEGEGVERLTNILAINRVCCMARSPKNDGSEISVKLPAISRCVRFVPCSPISFYNRYDVLNNRFCQ